MTMTREEIEERYSWREGEREQVMREMAARQRSIDAERILNEARATRTDQHHAHSMKSVTRDYLPPRRANPQSTANSAEGGWKNYIRQQLDQRQQILLSAVAQVMAEQEREHDKLAAELEPLRERMAELERELAEFKREAQLHATLDAIDARLERLETRSAPAMKVVSGRSATDRDTLIG